MVGCGSFFPFGQGFGLYSSLRGGLGHRAKVVALALYGSG